MCRNVYLVTKPNGKTFWTFSRPATDAIWKIVGTVEGGIYNGYPGTLQQEHPHGKPGTYQTWLSVIR